MRPGRAVGDGMSADEGVIGQFSLTGGFYCDILPNQQEKWTVWSLGWI